MVSEKPEASVSTRTAVIRKLLFAGAITLAPLVFWGMVEAAESERSPTTPAVSRPLLTAADLPTIPPQIPVSFDESKYVLSVGPFDLPEEISSRTDLPYDVAAFFVEYRRVPEQNAAPRYLYAFTHLSDSFIEEMYEEDVRSELKARLGRGTERFNVLFGRWNDNPDSVSDAELHEMSQFHKPYLSLIDWAQERDGCNFLFPLTSDYIPMELIGTGRRVSRMCQIEIADATRRGDMQTILHACKRNQRLADDIGKSQYLILHMIRFAMQNSVLNTIRTDVLPAQTLSESDLQQLLTYLETVKIDPMKVTAESIQVEYLFNLMSLSEIADQTMGAANPLKKLPVASRESDKQYLSKNVKRLLDATKSVSATPASDFLRISKEIESENEAIKAEIPDEPDLLSTALTITGVKKTPPVLAMMVLEVMSGALHSSIHSANSLNATRLLTVLEIHQRQSGDYPQNEQEFLEVVQRSPIGQLPVDYYAEPHPLRYRLIDGRPIVYSVGKDQTDDQGLSDYFASEDDPPRGDVRYFIGPSPN